MLEKLELLSALPFWRRVLLLLLLLFLLISLSLFLCMHLHLFELYFGYKMKAS